MINKKTNKISIIGAGFVGSASAYALMIQSLASEIVIVDINKEKAEGEAMDLAHGASFVKSVNVTSGDYADTANSDIVVITAGVGQKPGETRLDLINKNVGVFNQIIPQIVKYSPNSILLVVSNPVDILTHIAYKISGFPKERVIGSGTVLDTARLKYMLGEHLEIAPQDVNTYIVGEHGDSEIVAWSLTDIAGMPVDKYCESHEKCDTTMRIEIPEKVKHAAYEIINRKGYTNYAIGLSVARIVEAILRDENSILPLSSLFEGQYGISDVHLAIPTIVNRGGGRRIIEMPLSVSEQAKLKESGELLKSHIAESNLIK
ncbi:L-lactate dehydrogenase [uncultured Clostridium sp.]|uniref:L-lactate dehydrogenase n=1 Tax=uncultured Clostridium sp. TaxID=59620 RepID=UPI002617FD1D|nr:L-lactate dehydrogenase [uncultured Clostridium sp.]